VLWIQEERYLRETPLHEHSKALPPTRRPDRDRGVSRQRPHDRKGYNDIRLGIAAITARIRAGRLKINNLRCPNLCAEAKLYRYPTAEERSIRGRRGSRRSGSSS
jgi:hypothetical protein